MSIYRGEGGSGDATNDATVSDVTAQAVIASTKADEAAASATAAAASATSVQTLTAATGAAGSSASYNAGTNTLTVPRGDTGAPQGQQELLVSRIRLQGDQGAHRLTAAAVLTERWSRWSRWC